MKHYLTSQIREEKNIRIKKNGRSKTTPYDPEAVDKIAEKILKFFPGLTIDEIKLESRMYELFIPRQLWSYFSVMCFGYSHQKMSEHLGEKDHTTVYHAIRKLELLCDMSKTYAERLERIFYTEIIGDEGCILNKEEYL